MSLNEVWEAASANSFSPVVPKDNQFFVGFNLLLIGRHNLSRDFQAHLLIRLYLAFVLTGVFGLS